MLFRIFLTFTYMCVCVSHIATHASRETCLFPISTSPTPTTTPYKKANGIPLVAVEYHSVSFSTIGSFNGISAELSGILNRNLNYHSIPLNGTKNPKCVHSDTIQIPLAIIPPRTIQVPFNQWHLNGIFL